MKRTYGYKGSETTLNGLTSWVEDRIEFKGKAYDRRIEACKIIVKYAAQKFDGFYNKGQVVTRAFNAAALINKNNLFNDFVKWFMSSQGK